MKRFPVTLAIAAAFGGSVILTAAFAAGPDYETRSECNTSNATCRGLEPGYGLPPIPCEQGECQGVCYVCNGDIPGAFCVNACESYLNCQDPERVIICGQRVANTYQWIEIEGQGRCYCPADLTGPTEGDCTIARC